MPRLRRNAPHAVLVLLAAALSLPLAACTAQTVPTARTTTALTSTGWVPDIRADLADGGTLRLPLAALPSTYQVHAASGGSSGDLTVASLSLPSFVRITQAGGWMPDPDYATQVMLVSTAPQVVEVRIDPKVVWSDGTPLTVADVTATWQALRGDPAFALQPDPVWRDVTSVHAGVDDHDVLIDFARADADWPSALRLIYPHWALDTPAHAAAAWASGPLAAGGSTYVSAGPFVLDSIDAGAGLLTFTRNPRWWGEPPKLDRIVLTVVAPDDQGEAFANHELDVVDLRHDADTYRDALSRTDARVLRAHGVTRDELTLNSRSTVFADARLREAFALTLDRAGLARAVVGGDESQVETADSLVLVPGQDGYTDRLSVRLAGGAARARALLNAAGYDTSGDVATRSGAPLTVRFVVPTDATAAAAVAQLVAAQAAAGGFRVEVDQATTASFDPTASDTDVTYRTDVASAFPMTAPEAASAAASQRSAPVTATDLPSLAAQADAAQDWVDRIADVNALDQRLVDLYTVVPLFTEPLAWGVTSQLRNYGPTQFESVVWQDVGFVA